MAAGGVAIDFEQGLELDLPPESNPQRLRAAGERLRRRAAWPGGRARRGRSPRCSAGQPISLQPDGSKHVESVGARKRDDGLRIVHGLFGRGDEQPLVAGVAIFGERGQTLDAADRKLHAVEPGDAVEHLHVGDDLAAELDQQAVGRLVGRFVEPGEKVFVRRSLVGDPQHRVDELVVAGVAGDESGSNRRANAAARVEERPLGLLACVELHVRPPSLSKQSPSQRMSLDV